MSFAFCSSKKEWPLEFFQQHAMLWILKNLDGVKYCVIPMKLWHQG